MENMENIVYTDYAGRVRVDEDALIVSMWNKYIEGEGNDIKVFRNTPENFNEKFENPYDAAWAVSYGDWRWTDEYAYFDDEGCLTSFSHWNDGNSPIDIDKIDVISLINNLKKRSVNNTPVNNIPRAIHDALKEV